MFQVWHNDCFDVLPFLPAGSVDLVVCDLPYGTTQNKWDSIIPFEALWREYVRLCRGAVVLTAGQPFTSALVMSKPDAYSHCWIWVKSRPTGHLNAKRQPMRAHEDILVFAPNGPAPYTPQGLKPHGKIARRSTSGSNYGRSGLENFQEFTNYPRTLLEFESESGAVHPTQKPVALIEYLIATYSKPGDVVLDNCLGSGTTGVAAAQTGRRFIGIEKEEKFARIAFDRIKAAAPDAVLRRSLW